MAKRGRPEGDANMTMLCPYCHGPITGAAALPRMPARMMRVYTAALEAGSNGIDTSELLVKMYAEDEWPTAAGGTVLRVQIHELNKIIAPLQQRIVNWHRGRYRLVSTAEDKSAEEVQQLADH